MASMATVKLCISLILLESRYGTVHRKGNDNSICRLMVFGKSTSFSVNFWWLSTDRHDVLTGNGNH